MTATDQPTPFPPPQRSLLTPFLPRLPFPAKAELRVFDRPGGTTCARLGFNVEVQEHAETANLWDYLADSGATVLREFHPEVNLRRRQVAAGTWGTVTDQAGFERVRRRIAANPRQEIDWDSYRFSDLVPWLGVPDAIIAQVNRLEIEALVPLGYAPAMYPRPLVRNLAAPAPVPDADIDWEAACSAYEYCFALTYHFANNFGVRRFMLINEPEWRSGSFALPPEVAALGDGWFKAFFLDYSHEDLRIRFFHALAVQLGVIARLARMALDDVAGALGLPRLALLGPAASNWEVYWPYVADHVDVADYHHYTSEPQALRARFTALAQVAGNRPLGLGEVGRIAGEMEIGESYLVHDNAMAFAGLMMELMRLGGGDLPRLAYACIYLFSFPCTHRNYKALVYGDMNLVDWTGCDLRLHNSPDHHPSREELELRFPTAAYFVFRMLARTADAQRLEAPLILRDSARAPLVHKVLDHLVVRRGDSILITILNRGAEVIDPIRLDLGALPRHGRHAVIRRTGMDAADEVADACTVTDGGLMIEVPPRSLVQVILHDRDPAGIVSSRLSALPSVSGRLEALGLWQTVRLRCLATDRHGEHDRTDLDVIWRSSAPRTVRVGSGGLVQRLRHTDRTVRLQAALPDGRILGEIAVPPPQDSRRIP